MIDFEHSQSDGHPLFPEATYHQWLTLHLGTAEQQERYRQAITWYAQHPRPKPLLQKPEQSPEELGF